MSTREKILDTALVLFNKDGTAAISTNHIAEAAGISPGNLYYHFRNKEEIVRELFERLYAITDEELRLPEGTVPTLENIQQIVKANYKILWQFRFVYRELAALLRNDPELRRNFLAFRKRGFEGFHQLFGVFVMGGILRKSVNAETINNLAELCWLITEFWLNSLEISGNTVDESKMERGVELMMLVLEPYILR